MPAKRNRLEHRVAKLRNVVMGTHERKKIRTFALMDRENVAFAREILDEVGYFATISLLIPIEFSIDIFNIGGRGTKNAKSQCGTGSEDQWA